MLSRIAWSICLALMVTTVGCSDSTDSPNPDATADATIASDTTPAADLAGDGTDGSSDTGQQDGSLTTACPVKGYQPCGGDLKGAWTFVSLCPNDQKAADDLLEHPFDNLAACKDRQKNFVIGKWKRDGSMAFDGAKVTVKMKTELIISYGFTDACLKAVKPAEATPQDACNALSNPGKLSCTYAAGQGCSCTGTVKAPDEDTTTSYSVSGNTFTVGKDQATYCRSGQVLIFDWKKHPISWRYWILKRSP